MDNADIDFKEIAKTILRQKKLVSIISVLSLTTGIIYSFTVKRVWQGEFQILLSPKNQRITNNITSSLRINPSLSNLIGKSQGNELETEVEVLKSPSVLMNVFEFIKKKKQKEGEDLSNWRFSKWEKKNLDVELVEDTSVLNLSYRDTDKNLIIPVLKKISSEYQRYSGKDRDKNLSNGVKFLKDQIESYSTISKKSSDTLQNFASKYDLSAKRIGSGRTSSFIVNVEEERIRNANIIRIINEKIRHLKDYKNEDPEFFIARIRSLTSNNLDPTSNDKALIELDNIESQIAKLKAILKDENDQEIQELNNRRIALINLLKEKTFRQLEAEKVNAESALTASQRPDPVIFKYIELLRNAEKDAATLSELENQYRLLSLEQAKSQDPWELITDPTLLKDPVAPQRKRIALASLISGIFLGCLVVILREKTSGIIYQTQYIKYLLGEINTIHIKSDNYKDSNQVLELFINKEAKKSLKQTMFIEINEIPLNISRALKAITNKIKGTKYTFTNDFQLNEYKLYENDCSLILIIFLGKVTKKELIKLKQKLDTAEINLDNLVIIE